MKKHNLEKRRLCKNGLLFKLVKSICYLLILCSFFGCSSQEKNPIYYKGRTFIYQVKTLKDSTVLRTDKIKLKVTDNLSAKIMFLGKQTGIKWVYETVVDSTSGKPITETTGVIDDSTQVYLHPPRLNFMSFTEIPPFPNIFLPPDTRSTITVTTSVVKGFGKLDGKKLKQTFKVIGKENLTLFDKKYKDVWVIQGGNTNYIDKIGQYKVTYWFDQNYGFIRMKYEKPNGEIVDLKLKPTED